MSSWYPHFPRTCIPTILPTKSFRDFITIFSFLLIWLSWVINLYEFSEPLHIRYGTQRNVVRQGCTSCIKINFLDGKVLFLIIHSSFDLRKFAKKNHGFVNFSNGIEAMQKFWKFSFVERYNSLLTSFRATRVCH